MLYKCSKHTKFNGLLYCIVQTAENYLQQYHWDNSACIILFNSACTLVFKGSENDVLICAVWKAIMPVYVRYSLVQYKLILNFTFESHFLLFHPSNTHIISYTHTVHIKYC